ncbi:hypothetical protein CNR22_07505 [Sphingobacteriaceae bacterium]|nr:hypothetical protein CNR22_07505 [Sphingobacteriaceae bacterium]
MRSFASTYKYYLLLAFTLLLAEFIVNPIGNFPLNDDWTYGKSVLIFDKEGTLTTGEFAAMSLLTHILWGGLFTKVFGFSFTILRISTLLSSLIGVFTLNKLIVSISGNRITGFVACLVLLFNPLYFNLGNTFMTDVNFNTLLVVSCYFGYDYFKTRNKISFVLVFIMSALLVLIRQFGIIVPMCFTLTCFIIKDKRWLNVGMAILCTGVVYGLFKYYESYLQGVLSPGAAYKFSGNVSITSSKFWDIFFYNWELRYKKIALHVLIYTFPFTLFFLNDILKSLKPLLVVVIAVASILLVHYGFRNENFMIGNVFTNTSLGAETFYETLTPAVKDYPQHTFTISFEGALVFVKYLFGTLSLFVLIALVIRLISETRNPLKREPVFFFFFSLFFAYAFLILITESYFDRYHIPLISLAIILFSFISKRFEGNYRLILLPLMLFVYVSVFGTKDYLQINALRWQAYNTLVKEEKVEHTKINGGFEVNCWNEGEYNWWADFITLENFDYLIQYREQPGFKVYKTYEFQRYFPYKKDEIKVLIKEVKE